MPYCRCRACDASFHLRVVTDLEAWYRAQAPEQKVGDVVDTLLCAACWKKADQQVRPPGEER